MLLAGAGLLIRSFAALLANATSGSSYRAPAVVANVPVGPAIPPRSSGTSAPIRSSSRIPRRPGVEDVGVVTALPFHPSQIDAGTRSRLEGARYRVRARSRCTSTIASPAYFRVMGIPLLAGRPFGDHDRRTHCASRSSALAPWRGVYPDTDPDRQTRDHWRDGSARGAPRSSASSATCARRRSTASRAPNCSHSVRSVPERQPDVRRPREPRAAGVDSSTPPDGVGDRPAAIRSTTPPPPMISSRARSPSAGSICSCSACSRRSRSGSRASACTGWISVTTGQRTQEFGVRVALGCTAARASCG